LLGIGKSLGERIGDIDGDGRQDRIALSRCVASTSSGQKLIADVHLGSGESFVQMISDRADGNAGWLGISDINGDGRGDILAVSYGGVHSQWVVPIEYLDHRLIVIPGDFEPDGLNIDSSIATSAGFMCSKADGHVQIMQTEVALSDFSVNSVYEGTVNTFTLDANGVFRKVAEKPLSFATINVDNGVPGTPSEVRALVGAHCPKLDKFPPSLGN
jgi:hypothetical protein